MIPGFYEMFLPLSLCRLWAVSCICCALGNIHLKMELNFA